MVFTFLGTALVTLLTVFRTNTAGIGVVSFQSLNIWQYGYLAVSSVFAISAMLLPSISGSSLLLILGVYIPAISAVKELFHLHMQYLPGVAALALGVVIGVVFAVRLIRKALHGFSPQITSK